MKDSLPDNLLSAYCYVFPGDSYAVTHNLLKALQANNMDQLVAGLNSMTGSIPYEHWKADHESIFHIIMHLTFKKIGVDIESEVHSSKGRCDVIIKTASHIYAIELKLDKSAKEAMDQIFEKGYLHPYQSDPRRKIAIGINFSSEKREIDGYLLKESEQ